MKAISKSLKKEYVVSVIVNYEKASILALQLSGILKKSMMDSSLVLEFLYYRLLGGCILGLVMGLFLSLLSRLGLCSIHLKQPGFQNSGNQAKAFSSSRLGLFDFSWISFGTFSLLFIT